MASCRDGTYCDNTPGKYICKGRPVNIIQVSAGVMLAVFHDDTKHGILANGHH